MVEIQENQPVLTTNVLEMSATTTEMPFPVVCLDEFDQRRRNPCLYGEWTRRFYFDHSTKRCTMFWLVIIDQIRLILLTKFNKSRSFLGLINPVPSTISLHREMFLSI